MTGFRHSCGEPATKKTKKPIDYSALPVNGNIGIDGALKVPREAHKPETHESHPNHGGYALHGNVAFVRAKPC